MATAEHDASLSLLARHLRYARREAARREHELEEALAAAHADGAPHRRLARTLAAAWGVRLSPKELARFTQTLRKKLSRARTRRHGDHSRPPRATRSRATRWPFESEVSMNERVVRRVTTTVVEELDRCAPCAVPTPGSSEGLSDAIERDGPTCPRTPLDDGTALTGEVVDLRDDDLVA